MKYFNDDVYSFDKAEQNKIQITLKQLLKDCALFVAFLAVGATIAVCIVGWAVS